jgi:hypothetical protein
MSSRYVALREKAMNQNLRVSPFSRLFSTRGAVHPLKRRLR